jgi:peptidyl-prolyl cis-trans isomerase C
VLATVNGQPLTRTLFDQMQKDRQEPNPFDQAAGVPAPPPVELDRAKLLDELIFTELLAQKAIEAGLDRDPSVQTQRLLMVNTVLSQQMVRGLIAQTTVSPEELAALYKDRVPPYEFKWQQVVLPERPQAEALIARAQRGEPWSSLAPKRRKSSPADWQMFSQLDPAVASAIRYLEPGRVALQPVAVDGGWAVLRLEDRRKTPRPSLEEAGVWLRPRLLAQKVQARMDAWRQEAQIEMPAAPATHRAAAAPVAR